MKILFLSKASTKIGFGHLIRSKTLANGFAEINKDLEIDFITVGDDSVQKMLVSSPFFVKVFSTENEIQITKNYDLVFFDMMEISDKKFNEIKKRSKLLISLSPIFNKQPEVDVLFHRTKYIDDVDLPEKVYAGLNFSIIQKDCKKIGAGLYEDNLNSSSFPVAISMGGGDAPNKTLRVLKSLKKCKVPATFWVMLGEGYQYSYDDLVNETKTDTNHEIILSNTNKSMWQILKNCLMIILPSGITTHEAAYAGLPAVNFLGDEERYFLIKELVESNVSLYSGVMNDKNLLGLNKKIEYLYHNRDELFQMHVKSKILFKTDPIENIFKICKNELKLKNTSIRDKNVIKLSTVKEVNEVANIR